MKIEQARRFNDRLGIFEIDVFASYFDIMMWVMRLVFFEECYHIGLADLGLWILKDLQCSLTKKS